MAEVLDYKKLFENYRKYIGEKISKNKSDDAINFTEWRKKATSKIPK